ncbi:cyclic nucleotide-binding domain-containing protein [Brachyspira intermedia]|uniref:cyclic nucleotide-binding domain-containing protein n=1 Tax=Brachyspira intermedia TaxID=84377 RepID=UPI00262CDC46|nr:cyclic nucleotide-binding domain-containing protein [uncultured Brachyspira sp.]
MKKYRLVKYKKGDTILKNSQISKDCFYIITKGSIRSYNNFYNNTYKMGNIIGLIASITKEPYYSTVEAIEDTELWEIKIENINKINNKHLINKISNYLSFVLEIWLSKYYSLIIKNKIDLYNKEDILTMASIYKDNGFIDASYKLCLSYINMFENDYHVHNIEDVKKFMKTLSKSKEPEHIENNSYKMYKGYCIYTELEATDHIYYIRSGRIGIYNIADSSYITRMIYPAHFVIDDYAPTLEYKTLFTTAIVLEDSIVEILTKEELVKKLHDNAELRFRMIKITSMKVISTILKIKSINKTELKDKLIVLIYAILKIETLFSEKTYIKLYYKIEDIKNMMHDDIDINDIQNALKNIEYLETDCFNNIIITDSCKYFKEYESYTK